MNVWVHVCSATGGLTCAGVCSKSTTWTYWLESLCSATESPNYFFESSSCLIQILHYVMPKIWGLSVLLLSAIAVQSKANHPTEGLWSQLVRSVATIAPRVLQEAARGQLGISLVSFPNILNSTASRLQGIHRKWSRQMASLGEVNSLKILYFWNCLFIWHTLYTGKEFALTLSSVIFDYTGCVSFFIKCSYYTHKGAHSTYLSMKSWSNIQLVSQCHQNTF